MFLVLCVWIQQMWCKFEWFVWVYECVREITPDRREKRFPWLLEKLPILHLLLLRISHHGGLKLQKNIELNQFIKKKLSVHLCRIYGILLIFSLTILGEGEFRRIYSRRKKQKRKYEFSLSQVARIDFRMNQCNLKI